MYISYANFLFDYNNRNVISTFLAARNSKLRNGNKQQEAGHATLGLNYGDKISNHSRIMYLI